MNQILHILRKDIQRHWPEFVVSLAVLILYLWQAPQQWAISQDGGIDSAGPSVFLFWFAHTLLTLIPVLLVISWCFLIIRVIHSEKLVGDRLFWVTRPYEWQKLLITKLLFLLVFINLPLFVGQLVLLKKSGFLSASHVWNLVGMQIGVAVLLILAAFTLAVLTSSLGQVVLVVIAAFVVFSTIFSLYRFIRNFEMSSAVEPWSAIETVIEMIAPLAVILWQYSRRRTWQSRKFLLLIAAALLIIEAIVPYISHVERRFPVVDASRPLPVRITFLPLDNTAQKLELTRDWGGQQSIRIPLQAVGVADGSVIRIAGSRIKILGAAETIADPGWTSTWQHLWPNTETTDVDFRLDKKVFDLIKATPVTVEISLALTEFRETSPRELLLRDGEFPVSGLGICRLADQLSVSLVCRLPNQGPAFMARAQLSTTACQQRDAISTASIFTGYDFRPPVDNSFITPRLNPVDTFSISPGARDAGKPTSRALARRELRLCPGTSLHLATPVEAAHFRIELYTSPIVLADYVLRQVQPD